MLSGDFLPLTYSALPIRRLGLHTVVRPRVVSRTANGEKSAHDSKQGSDGGLARKTRSAVSD